MGIIELLFIAIIVLVSSPLYFAPLIVAVVRGHESRTAIGLINLFLGWSGIAWVAVLVWSFLGESHRR